MVNVEIHQYTENNLIIKATIPNVRQIINNAKGSMTFYDSKNTASFYSVGLFKILVRFYDKQRSKKLIDNEYKLILENI